MELNFTIKELCYSSTASRLGISNMPSIAVCDNLMLLIVNVLQPLRTALKRPVTVSSGYRCEQLNEKVGGASNSQHKEGKAVDITVKGVSIDELFNYIKNSPIEYDQLIHEGTWVHISFNKGKNRKQAFRIAQ
jgi:D-alanyl-D-alanine dipeptidase